MAKSILKGITVEIDGDAADLIAALDSAERAAKRLGRTAEETRKALVLKWDGGDFEKAQAAAQGAVDRTEGSVRALRQALENLDAAGGGRRAQRQLDELHAQLDKAQRKAAEARARLQEIDGVRLDHIAKQADDIGNAMLRMGAKLTADISSPIALAAKEAVAAATTLAQTQELIGASFGASAGAVEGWSRQLVQGFGMSELTAKQYAAAFMALSNAAGVAQQDGARMATALTELSADLAAFYNVGQEAASSALQGVFTGDAAALRQFGVAMDESALAAYALAQGVEAGYGQLSQAEQAMLRYQYVVEALSAVQGSFAASSDSLANQQRILQAQLQTMALDLGEQLLPIVTNIVAEVNKALGAFSNLSEGQRGFAVSVLAVLAAVGPVSTVLGGVNKVVGAGVTAFQTIVPAARAAWNAYQSGTSVVAALTAALNLNAVAQGVATAGLSLLVGGLAALAVKIATTDYDLANYAGTMENLDKRMADIAQNGFASAGAELAKLDNVAENILPRIQELADSTNRTAAETGELQGLIGMLNEQLGYEAASFDAATGLVNMNTNAIMQNIQAMRQRAVASAAAREYDELGQQLYDNKKERKELYAQLEKNTKAYNEQVSLGLEVSPGIVMEREDIKSQLEQSFRLDSAVKKSMDGIFTEYMLVDDAGAAAEEVSSVDGMTREQREEAFRRDQDELQRMRAIGVIDLAEYRKNMNRLNVLYNTDSAEAYKENYARINGTVFSGEKQMTEAVRSGGSARAAAARSALDGQTAEVKKAYDAQVQAVRDAYAQQKQAAQEAHDAQMAAIDEELAAREAAIDAQIRAIDEEIEARRRQKQEEDYDGQIASIQASIDYGAGKFDEFTLRELRAQLAAVEAERADYRWNLEQEDRKAALQAQLEDARAVAGQQKAALQEMYDAQLAAMEEEYQLHLEQLDAVFKTADGAFREISAEFAAAMQAGAESAAAALRAAIGSAYSAAAAQERTRAAGSVSTTDARTYSPSVTLNNSGYSERQVARIVEQMTYE